MSICQKVKDLYQLENVKYTVAAEKLKTDNVSVGKYLYRGPMNLKRLVLLADVLGYKLVLENKDGISIIINPDDVGREW
ncbi:hypothetical protein [Phascolarctobacterium succinatutens]|uniref:hypothetical protein n=1 Tax=Phascolarctobacterium succinatutens TaxID=626940 RepID=UPI003AB6F74E